MMDSPAVLFVRPGAIKASDKRALQNAGIIVVDVENPQDVKLVRAHTELPYGDLLYAATKAVQGMDYTKQLFGEAVVEAIQRRYAPTRTEKE